MMSTDAICKTNILPAFRMQLTQKKEQVIQERAMQDGGAAAIRNSLQMPTGHTETNN